MPKENSNTKNIKEWLKREIHIMRELLANLVQEELAILMRDERGWQHLFLERTSLVEALKKLHHASSQLGSSSEQAPENQCDLTSLKEQILSLTEKMLLQSKRNTKLFEVYGNHLGEPLKEYYHPQKKPKSIQITTLDNNP